jgi:hypothetical protein
LKKNVELTNNALALALSKNSPSHQPPIVVATSGSIQDLREILNAPAAAIVL